MRSLLALLAVVLSAATGCSGGKPATAAAAPRPTQPTQPPPRYAHVVVVVEENHSYADIVGNNQAPYLNALAARGVTFSASYAVTHPSEPNYLALFSGSPQGVSDDSCDHSFTAPSLASQLRGTGRTFVGYSESLPQPDFGECSANSYARKHAPWTFFSNLPTDNNQPFSAFPTDYRQLPTVSFVIPNLDNDMHDGSVARGDSWLHEHLDSYARWAVQNDSLLLVTWDEDDSSSDNHIATLAVGARLPVTTDPRRIDHYAVLRTLEAIYHLPGLGNAASASPIPVLTQ